jgi:hypothetical protein
MNTAKVLKQFIVKKEGVQKKINALQDEINSIDDMQKKWEAPIMELLGGRRIEDVVEYRKELQSNGKYATKIVFRYPETIVPVEDTECEAEQSNHCGADIDEDMPGDYVPTPDEAEMTQLNNMPEAKAEPAADSEGSAEEAVNQLWDEIDNPEPANVEDDPFA